MKQYSNEQRAKAENLYIIEEKTQADIRRLTGICRQTLVKWSVKDQWKKRRKAYQEAIRRGDIDKILAVNMAFSKTLEALSSDNLDVRMHMKGEPEGLKSIQLHIYF